MIKYNNLRESTTGIMGIQKECLAMLPNLASKCPPPSASEVAGTTGLWHLA